MTVAGEFPILSIHADSGPKSVTPTASDLGNPLDGVRVSARGAFAQAQADFLEPDPDAVTQLRESMIRHEVGIVAHFYMDPELQGVLYGVGGERIHVSDSLVMADRAIEMANAGARNIVVLGVDFMAENVRAMLDEAGHENVDVFRVAADPIGCSLAESAESSAYAAYLEQAGRAAHPLHVIYINTSLKTKAHAQRRVPTLTCTSSNVVRSVLSAFADVPDLSVFFGPDTYMGENIRAMFEVYAKLPAEKVAQLHPDHTPESLSRVLERFRYFEQGNCVVHHMFGAQVVAKVEREYPNAEVAAHLEVPGEMFQLALAAQRRGRGVAGSTSDILGYMSRRVEQALRDGQQGTLQFVLGTETGMVTAIVRRLRKLLAGSRGLQVDIIFPVADAAVAATSDSQLPLVPGVAAGEGCSTAGGCATCPFMKMNSLDALGDLLAGLHAPDELAAFRPRAYSERLDGETMAAVGRRPILHMRDFQRLGRLGPDLRQEIANHVSRT